MGDTDSRGRPRRRMSSISLEMLNHAAILQQKKEPRVFDVMQRSTTTLSCFAQDVGVRHQMGKCWVCSGEDTLLREVVGLRTSC